ncbi:hypothetical protein [Leptospira kmetyi]|uniref:hypothetical protein n=1 Tax=Leptospira kmetyi TaxID=408139 RepID=UPI001082D404|nr:hypothetical protein [Leptospira kmetyi]TGK14280.1 hypothetical protein EHO62_16950 [Leptospira kmetyi]TGK25114.1 hypothetical protein EHO66_19040 [Leptospira kmetyi]
MKEVWKQWPLHKNLFKKYSIDEVADTLSGVRIRLGDVNQKIDVIFSNSVSAYRSVEDGFRQNLINDLIDQYGSDFITKCTFFQVENSKFLNWLIEESYGFIDAPEIKHFSFLASNSILDVVANYEPEIIIHDF